ncbi:hypothetical protein [Massilia genomosp. 1]|uniref:Uncharacterized protein n=1 Tax=Massilia genomosp. 1 TaxID=2609280 RepID=A0ABX0MR97_9BURK|nr:hypothetical protein [Massilia genomosp. 1]NHZ64602.1 hypothetical protein [Massilia genomosp. 1]
MINDQHQQCGAAGNPEQHPQQGGNCCPGAGGPAGQPKMPGAATCAPPDTSKDPKVPPITGTDPCPALCLCPPAPGSTSNCFDQLIADQARAINEAERAKSFKADLEALLQKAKLAQDDYTTEKYHLLLDRWKQQDRDIAELIHRIVCAAPCWRCQVECQVCSLFNKVRSLELLLKGRPDQRYDKAYCLYDQRYWQERDLALKQAAFDRVKRVLTVWEKPGADIEAVLNENLKLMAGVKELASDSAKGLYDVFIRLLPLHLAIAPPASTAVTVIDKKYTELCTCGAQDPDDCCGPDVGPQSVRMQMLDRHAYLVEPAKYFPIICCLVNHRYLPVKDALAKAEADLKSTDAEIKRVADEIKARMDSIEKDAKAELAKPFDCSKYTPVPPCDGAQRTPAT